MALIFFFIGRVMIVVIIRITRLGENGIVNNKTNEVNIILICIMITAIPL